VKSRVFESTLRQTPASCHRLLSTAEEISCYRMTHQTPIPYQVYRNFYHHCRISLSQSFSVLLRRSTPAKIPLGILSKTLIIPVCVFYTSAHLILLYYLFPTLTNISLNISLPPPSSSSKWVFSERFLHQNSCLPHTG
jgi:hypothetical protein